MAGAALLVAALLLISACQPQDRPHAARHLHAVPRPRALAPASARTWTSPANHVTGIHKIKHVVVVMQENRSFGPYFGPFPRADRIPMEPGRSVACEPPAPGLPCQHLFVDHADV